ncbi:MAG: ATP phosphoribosyltransferase regulatory subunit [Oscillospiraceae bacterium]|nr:ATP phosphoribosyltransferase regulatory subunit [Oscillospiraceae bacterium]
MTFRAIGTPEGTADRLFADCAAIRRVQRLVTDLFRRRGYDEVMTPEVEFFDLFGDIAQENLRVMVDRTGKLLVMRPDNTAPIARVAATKLKTMRLPQRLYYNQTVFRADDAHTGSRGEIAQCGVELIGASGYRADLEVLSMGVQALEVVGLRDFRLEIGHAGFFPALAAALGAENDRAMRDALEQGNFDAYQKLLQNYLGAPLGRAMAQLPRLSGGEEVLERARALFQLPAAQEILDSLERLYRELEAAGLGERVQFDLGLVPKFGYYTGMVFRGYALGAGSIVLSGGRYDALLGKFGFDAPATGFAVDAAALAGCTSQAARTDPKTMLYYAGGCLGQALRRVMTASAGTCAISTCETEQGALVQARAAGAEQLIVIDTNGERSVTL